MFEFRRLLRYILKSKNSQIKKAMEQARATSCENRILSAYIALIASRYGVIRIPKKEISDTLGRFGVLASSDGEDYVIEVFELGGSNGHSGVESAEK